MKRLTALGTALALSVVAAPAAAATIVVTAEGTLSYGHDYFNTFGVGMDLTGKSVLMVFRFDDETPGASYVGAGDYQYIQGSGPDYNASHNFSPGVATVTVGGSSLGIGGDYYSSHSLTAAYGVGGVLDSVQTSVHDMKYFYNEEGFVTRYLANFSSLTAIGMNLLSSADLGQDLDFSPASDVHVEGNFQFYSKDYVAWSGDVNISGRLDPGSITISVHTLDSPTGAVPEPATWAMMILGFGALGGVMRSRRRAVAGGALAGA